MPFLSGFTKWGYLDNKSISLNATNLGAGTEFNTQYYLHNINGHVEMKVINEAIIKTNGTKTF